MENTLEERFSNCDMSTKQHADSVSAGLGGAHKSAFPTLPVGAKVPAHGPHFE